MDYNFLDSSINTNNIILPESDKINSILIKNHQAEILKAIDFINSDEKFLYLHGFMGTGKRQFINYICDFLSQDVIKLEYYCKPATVCDDILLAFTEVIESNSISKAVNLNTKITTLAVKLQQQISSIKKPFLIVLQTFDDVSEDNMKVISEVFAKFLEEENVKLIISTRGMNPSVLGDVSEDRKIFLKGLTKENFVEYLETNQVVATDRVLEDFYALSRGYYYYAALTAKVLQAMRCNLAEFMQKFKQSEMSFESFLGSSYINFLPPAIRNFFWFMRTVRHGLSFNALAVFDIYDEFSIGYLKTNLMIFQVDETIYVQDYFLQDIDFAIPEKTQIKLHKYIINIYEKQLKESLKTRSVMLSRQAMRSEIEYHNECINKILNAGKQANVEQESKKEVVVEKAQVIEKSVEEKIKFALELIADKKYTQAIESLRAILEQEGLDVRAVVEIRLKLAKAYQEIAEYKMASHFYELVETYYKQNKELINLNYLYYDMADLYYKMYKHERAIETIKQTIYSVDTPQSLLVSSCTMLGNIYSDMNNSEEAYMYYKKALDSLDENVDEKVLAELYFKYALASDDRDEDETAFEYYTKCISVSAKSPYKALAYSNMASCYFDNESYDEALDCFIKSYKIEKNNNNYDGIYFTSSHIAKIYIKKGSKKAFDYLIEAKKSAEFINEDFYIIQADIALGDYYYNSPKDAKEALTEYLKARNIALKTTIDVDIDKINQRIDDMKLRMDAESFEELVGKYDNN